MIVLWINEMINVLKLIVKTSEDSEKFTSIERWTKSIKIPEEFTKIFLSKNPHQNVGIDRCSEYYLFVIFKVRERLWERGLFLIQHFIEPHIWSFVYSIFFGFSGVSIIILI